jgi:hypothetical protein
MDLKKIVKDTTRTIVSYLTYQAVRVVVAQLYETNPALGIWLNQFSTTEKIQDGEAYITALFDQQQDLAFRILTVREHLAQEVCDWLPEMVRSGIQQANMEHRRRHLERMTQFSFSEGSPQDNLRSDDATSETPPETNDGTPGS